MHITFGQFLSTEVDILMLRVLKFIHCLPPINFECFNSLRFPSSIKGFGLLSEIMVKNDFLVSILCNDTAIFSTQRGSQDVFVFYIPFSTTL